jgi:hypothetical protein
MRDNIVRDKKPEKVQYYFENLYVVRKKTCGKRCKNDGIKKKAARTQSGKKQQKQGK